MKKFNWVSKFTKNLGFSLIELMIAIAIVGILSVIGTNQYFKYVINSKVSTAQTYLLAIMEYQERYFTTNGVYATTLPSGLAALPDAIKGHYLPVVMMYTTTQPKKFAVGIQPDPNSPMMKRFRPTPNQPTTTLVISSEHQKWFESTDACFSTCNCSMASGDMSWEKLEKSADWKVGARNVATGTEAWACSP